MISPIGAVQNLNREWLKGICFLWQALLEAPNRDEFRRILDLASVC